MSSTFHALLLLSILFLVQVTSSSNMYAQSDTHAGFEGSWEFEKAEYFEKESIHESFLLKRNMTDMNDLNALNEKIHYPVMQLTIDKEIAEVLCPSAIYTGKHLILDMKGIDGAFSILTIGSPEEEGSEYNGKILNAPGIQYRIEKTSENKIAIYREDAHFRDGKTIYGAVRCILKKIN